MIRVLCVVIGYVFGLFQTSYIYGRMNGIDIRDHGSGNAGTTNALRTLGKKAGVITFFGDALKCLFAVLLVKALFGAQYDTPDDQMSVLLGVYTAMGVILGHNYPFYLKFRGGKGIAATGGMIASLNPVLMIMEIITFAGTVLITRYVSLGSILVVLELFVFVVVFGIQGKWGLAPAHQYEMYVCMLFLTLLAIWRHRENIKRLLTGTERKIGEKAE